MDAVKPLLERVLVAAEELAPELSRDESLLRESINILSQLDIDVAEWLETKGPESGPMRGFLNEPLQSKKAENASLAAPIKATDKAIIPRVEQLEYNVEVIQTETLVSLHARIQALEHQFRALEINVMSRPISTGQPQDVSLEGIGALQALSKQALPASPPRVMEFSDEEDGDEDTELDTETDDVVSEKSFEGTLGESEKESNSETITADDGIEIEPTIASSTIPSAFDESSSFMASFTEELQKAFLHALNV